ncbi:MAG: hypothetical protein M1455_03590 [Actinobacteria bacterium]|nr:hypothetical protein [Actinomycetota bacterium]
MKVRRPVRRFALAVPVIIALALMAALLLIPSFIASAVAPSQITRASTDSTGIQGNMTSDSASVSSDGRYVAFTSDSNNLTGASTDNFKDVFVKDTQTGVTICASTDAYGNPSNGSSYSYASSISADGRYVAFSSGATNLVTGDTNGQPDVFVKDTQTGMTSLVSSNSSGIEGNNYSYYGSISDNGRYVAFVSASNLAPGGWFNRSNVYLKDTQTGTTTLISSNSSGIQGDSSSLDPEISGDGRYVEFISNSTNLVAGVTYAYYQSYVKDTISGTTICASTSSSGNLVQGNSQFASLSADGRYVAFQSEAINVVPGFYGPDDIYVKDTQTGITTCASSDSSGSEASDRSYHPSISGNGRYVAFESNATNLVIDDKNGKTDIFVKDTTTGDIGLVSRNADGSAGTSDSIKPAISSDGKALGFESQASNLVSDDTNNMSDVFVTPVEISAPVITNTLPTADQAGNSFNISADFSDSDSGIDNASIIMYVNNRDVTSEATITPGHISVNVTGDGTQNVGLVVGDNAHNKRVAQWSFAAPATYYFPWFDSLFGRTWVLEAQPFSGSPAARSNLIDIRMHNAGSGSMDLLANNMFINKGETKNMPPNGRMGGPVKVDSHYGDSLVSERSLFGNSFEEVWGTSYYNLDSHYWWPVYDSASAGMRNWILVANPPDNGENITVHVTVHNAGPDISEARDLAPGQTWTPIYAGRFGGPVEVKAWKQGGNEDSDPRKVIASQRVLYNGAFNEMPGIAASKLSPANIWTWYDDVNGSNWIVVSNPSSTKINAQIAVGNLNNPVYVDEAVLGAYETHAFRKPVMGGPVYAWGYNEGSSSPDANIVVSQRVLWGPSFGELAGSVPADISFTTSTWTWYDQASAGAKNWVLISNPTDKPLYAEVRIAGVTVWGDVVNPYDNKTPTFPGRMGGPVEVEAWKSETAPGGIQLKRTPYLVFASQRVLWNGYFNEIVGKGQ